MNKGKLGQMGWGIGGWKESFYLEKGKGGVCGMEEKWYFDRVDVWSDLCGGENLFLEFDLF